MHPRCRGKNPNFQRSFAGRYKVVYSRILDRWRYSSKLLILIVEYIGFKPPPPGPSSGKSWWRVQGGWPAAKRLFKFMIRIARLSCYT
jgi:hypothetical protein